MSEYTIKCKYMYHMHEIDSSIKCIKTSGDKAITSVLVSTVLCLVLGKNYRMYCNGFRT
jgi:hypothetical protein